LIIASRVERASAVIQIALFRRIWRVTLDGIFYGDYRSRRQAAEGADVAALALRTDGRNVQIVNAPDA
jgi:hypothetical protein